MSTTATSPPPLPRVGEKLPAVSLPVLYWAVAFTPSIMRDPFPGHFDAEYARSVGHRTVFMNTMAILGLMDRAATDWSGPGGFISRHEISMRKPIYAGSVAEVTGLVASVSEVDGPTSHRKGVNVEIGMTITTADGPCVHGSVTIVWPSSDSTAQPA